MKLLVCTDGSNQAENAIRFSGLIASTCLAEITLLGITEKPGSENETLDSLKRGRELLVERGINAELITKTGDPINEITRRAEQVPYDLVVIGAVRKGTRGPFLMSTKAYKVIKSVQPSVLVVIGARNSLNKILICTGGEKYIDRAVDFAGRIAQCSATRVTLFHVISDPTSELADLARIEEDVNLLLHSRSDLGRNLNREKETLEKLGINVDVRITHGMVVSEIFKEIKRGDYDLVVSGSSPSTGNLRSYIMGNITREIVNRAECPVLVVRGGEEPGGFRKGIRHLLSEIGFSMSSSEEKKE
jgi:nucleotide-binding universal stress UspA family protein